MSRENLKDRIVAIEGAYEFMLSFAARGMRAESPSPVRPHLENTAAALDGIGEVVRACVNEAGADVGLAPTAADAFVEVLERDAAASLAVVTMVLARETIGSQLVDNVNASIHLRALLTDLFLIDEVLDLQVGETSPPAQFAPDESEATESAQ